MRYILIFLAPLLLNAAMLLGVYKDQNLSGWVMSEKYDGVRAIWDGKNLKSRNNLNLTNLAFGVRIFRRFGSMVSFILSAGILSALALL